MPPAAMSEWRAPAKPCGPIDILAALSTTRTPELLPVHYAWMKTDPFAFLRGAARVMVAISLGIDDRLALAVARRLSLGQFRRLHHSQRDADLRDQ